MIMILDLYWWTVCTSSGLTPPALQALCKLVTTSEAGEQLIHKVLPGRVRWNSYSGQWWEKNTQILLRKNTTKSCDDIMVLRSVHRQTEGYKNTWENTPNVFCGRSDAVGVCRNTNKHTSEHFKISATGSGAAHTAFNQQGAPEPTRQENSMSLLLLKNTNTTMWIWIKIVNTLTVGTTL